MELHLKRDLKLQYIEHTHTLKDTWLFLAAIMMANLIDSRTRANRYNFLNDRTKDRDTEKESSRGRRVFDSEIKVVGYDISFHLPQLYRTRRKSDS
jgi:hypothetical protein